MMVTEFQNSRPMLAQEKTDSIDLGRRVEVTTEEPIKIHQVFDQISGALEMNGKLVAMLTETLNPVLLPTPTEASESKPESSNATTMYRESLLQIADIINRRNAQLSTLIKSVDL